MSNMKAAICAAYGSPDVIKVQEVAKPIPDKNQLLIKIMASAVNSGDVRVRSLDVKGYLKIIMRLVLGFRKPRKPVLGTTFCGVVEQTGRKVSKFKAGDKVFGMTGFKFSTHAEYITVDQNCNVLHMPNNAGFEEAAAIIFGGQTALYYLSKAKISEMMKPKVLILGATGSVGCASVQIAQYYKTDVTAVCSAEGQKLMNELGIKKTILYDKEKLGLVSEKFDIVFDTVGKYSKKQCKHLLNKNDVYVSVNMGYASENINQLRQLKAMFEAGALKPTIDKTFSLYEIVEAHRYVDSGRKKGNVILKMY